MISATQASGLASAVLTCTSGDAGCSYGEPMPVNCWMAPRRANTYSPFGSRASATSSATSTNTSTKVPGAKRARAWARASANGEISAAITMKPASVISRATSAVRRMFSRRSASLKPRSRFNPSRSVSPSS
ncbi:hypothetical protein WI92_27620 [Burkholderia vietnamiensis]|nr:hypothetical protein WI92_27620 [Burkholderia vietnamiensis]